MVQPNENGSYVITEQGDLGLGLTAINEQETKSIDQRNAEKQQSGKTTEADLY